MYHIEVPTNKEIITAKGVWTITKAFLETPYHFELNRQIEELKAQGKDFLSLVRRLNAVCRRQVFVINNIVPTVARSMIANNLTSASPTNVMKVTHFAVGTSSTAVSNSDTQLGTETYRNTIASTTNSNNVGYITGFFTATEVTGTFQEFGIFSNGTGTANSGVIVSHIISAITKSSSETLTMDWQITFS